MIQAVKDHIAERLAKIQMWTTAAGTALPGPVMGSKPGPFGFVAGSSEKITVKVVPAQAWTVTLTGSDRTAQQVADQFNRAARGAGMDVLPDGRLRIVATNPDDPIVIETVAHNCYEMLGFSVGSRQAAKYYPPGAERPKGITAFPCIAGSWYLPPAVDVAGTRPQHEVFMASDEQQTVEIPEWLGGGESTGPVEWTVKPCPVPHKLHLQLDLLAAKEAHAVAMNLLMLEAIPLPYSFELPDGRWARMLPDGDPLNLDELEAPLFRTAYKYEISNVWIDRQAAYTVPSIRETDIDFGVM